MLAQINLFGVVSYGIVIASIVAVAMARRKRTGAVVVALLVVAVLAIAFAWLIVEHTRVNVEAGDRARDAAM
jgi:4-amino-4-deoxy-L-arabinose transferase-like glycosyltransferase